MRYKITGVNSKTGTAVKPIELEADTEQDAHVGAKQQGVLPVSITLVLPKTVQQPITQRFTERQMLFGFAIVFMVAAFWFTRNYSGPSGGGYTPRSRSFSSDQTGDIERIAKQAGEGPIFARDYVDSVSKGSPKMRQEVIDGLKAIYGTDGK